MLDGGVEKAHKAVRANEPATSERATGKEIFPDGKKILDAGLWEKKFSRMAKKFLTRV